MATDMATDRRASVISKVARSYLRLSLTTDVGPIRLRRLIRHLGSVDAVLSASISELQSVEGIGPQVASSIFRSRDSDAADCEVERATACGLHIVCPEDADYPRTLLNIADPPICLYIRGKIEPPDSVAVAIVGTRGCSHYGREQAMRFGSLLARAGFTTITGLARGIDGHAHRGALSVGGRTIAVLGNGLSSIYPREHQSLADRIVKSGAVVTENRVDAQPEAKNFPRRNRIIAGLSLGVIVVEAGKRSGALITARLACEYNREVFAIPGHVDRPELTAGVHSLIRDGQAKLITNLDDVLDELGDVGEIMRRQGPSTSSQTTDEDERRTTVPSNLPADEQAVFGVIVEGSENADTICTATGLDMSRIGSVLTSLQLKGLVRQLPGNRFVKRSATPVGEGNA